MTEATAVSAGHQSKSCSVYEKCEDILFPEIIFLELNMFYKKSSETVKTLRKCNRTEKKKKNGLSAAKNGFFSFFSENRPFSRFFF